MITFKDLNEVFDRAVPYEQVPTKVPEVQFKYVLPNEKITVIFMVFNTVTPPNLAIDIANTDTDGETFVPRYGLRGDSKNQFKVYSTVYQIFKKLYAQGIIKRGTLINPSGTNERQDQMYSKIIAYFLKKGNIKKVYNVEFIGGKNYAYEIQ